DVAADVAVREHGALRIAGGTRGVHERGEIFGLRAAAQLVETRALAVVVVATAAVDRLREGDHAARQRRRSVAHDDGVHRGTVAAHFAELLQLFGVRTDDHGRAGVVEDVLDLPAEQRGINGNGDGLVGQ